MNKRQLMTNNKIVVKISQKNVLTENLQYYVYLHHKCICTNGHKSKMTKSNAITNEQIYKLKNPGDSWQLTGHHR
jgi:hypothetical protein